MSPFARFLIAAGVPTIALLSFLIANQFTSTSVCELKAEWTRHPEKPPEGCGCGGSSPPPDRKLAQAFGKGSEELRRPLRLWLPDKKVVLAAGEFSIAKDERIRLAPLSIALFKDNKKGEHPEIVLIRCDEALVTLHKPASSYADLASRRIVKAELSGGGPGVSIVYNRGSADKNQSLETLITNGSVVFDAQQHCLSTDGLVCVTDWQTKTPTILRGKGMEMQFAKPQPDCYVGMIERFTLRTDAEVRFPVDPSCSFMTVWHGIRSDRNFTIKTGGKLSCDLVKQTASFEAPNAGADVLGNNTVHVQRIGKVDGQDLLDQLTCDRLELQFRHGQTVDIVEAKATARPGNDVALALDSERTCVHGCSYLYAKGDAGKGFQNVVKGNPLLVAVDGDTIRGKELHGLGQATDNANSVVTMIGSGQIDLLGKHNPEKADYTKHIRWRDKLTIGPRQAGNWWLGSLKAYGAAEFVDEENQQEIRGEQIEVRLGRKPEAARK